MCIASSKFSTALKRELRSRRASPRDALDNGYSIEFRPDDSMHILKFSMFNSLIP